MHAGCLRDRPPAELGDLGTATHVDDLDAFRHLLDVETLDMLAASTSTQVGAAYAARFPHRVGRIVLDGVVPLTTCILSSAHNWR